jgi:hypothetical protein
VCKEFFRPDVWISVNVVDGAPQLLRASDDTSTADTVARNPRARRERIGRRWLVAGAGATVVVLVAGTALLTEPGEAGRQSEQTSASALRQTAPPTVPTTVASNAVTPPITAPGDGSKEDPLLPEGEPSTPHTGVLVASVAAMEGQYSVYDDGRLIWWSASQPESVEQRLTVQGVENVRARFLSTGLFGPGEPAVAVHSAGQVTACLCVRDGDRLLARSTERDVGVRAAAAGIISYFENLGSTLAPTDWADQQVKPYVASRIAVCLQMYAHMVEEPPEVAVLLPIFPTRAAELLGGRAPIDPPGDKHGSCFELTLEEAHALADAFLAPTGGGFHEYWGIVIRINESFDAMQPGADEGNAAYISFSALQPDGT